MISAVISEQTCGRVCAFEQTLTPESRPKADLSESMAEDEDEVPRLGRASSASDRVSRASGRVSRYSRATSRASRATSRSSRHSRASSRASSTFWEECDDEGFIVLQPFDERVLHLQAGSTLIMVATATRIRPVKAPHEPTPPPLSSCACLL